jgi:DNA-binding MarR family transcriptional regulator
VDSLIVFLSRIIYAQWTEVTAEWGLTPPMNKILRLLERRDQQPINELSEAMSCTKSNLTGVIDSMVERGLIRRVRSRLDRRVITITLTEKSRTLLRSIPPWSEIYRNSMTSRLSAREVRTLKTLLAKLHSLYRSSTERQKEER